MRSRQQVLGQNFLKHEPTIQRILNEVKRSLANDEVRERKPKTILEVGPGALALSRGLNQIALAEKLHSVVVERDRYLEQGIREGLPNSELHFFDAATEKMAELLSDLEQRQLTPVLFVSNLPYSAASQILAMAFRKLHCLSSAIVMVQKEMADRMCAQAGDSERGSFSLFVQSYVKPKVLFDVPPSAFTPPPKVMSTVLELEPLSQSIDQRIAAPLEFERFCKKLFSQRRKMIRNSLNLPKDGPLPPAFANLGINGTERPEVLDLEIVLKLYQAVGGK